ncbi:MAG: hypothetical protein JHC95_05575 [Solirubrobacteraceae bacterium]|nr:hypothetical protein [Solirubrobacteraceae bacterium]
MTDDAPTIDALLAPWTDAIGADLPAYRNHLHRVMTFVDVLDPQAAEHRTAYHVAAAFHDLGIWSDGTFDYLPPSIARATAWLQTNGHEDLVPLVTRMIDEHHKVRATGPADDPAEVFRRADWTDVTFGIRRFGIPRADYRAAASAHPDNGFHATLVKLTVKRTVHHPLSPLPMFRW